ncbi:restriction endonuclease subunit S [Empedobacter falsenii]|uniref:restriction endonuclease subunit S n=1 Tax=Empedobacter falsenii TaxID=343874 RepID=UPI003A7F99A7
MWQSKRLGDIATFINGYPFKPSDWNDEGLEIIRIQNLTKSSKECNYYKGEINSKYKITDGDILISWSATLGVFEWKGNDAWLNQHIFKVEFNKEPIDKKFFTFLIEHVLDDLKGQVHGATMKHITKSNFDNTLVPIPPLATQKAIAEKLDKADALRKKDQELLKQYDELAQSIFIDMFGDPVQNEKGWEKIQLGNFITTLVDVGSNGANDWVSANIKMKDEEDYAMMIRTTNLSNNDFSDNLKYVTEETYNLFKKTKVFGGEVIMNKIGSAGDFWIMPNLNRPVSLGLNQLMFEFENLNTLFFKHYFSTDYGVKLIKSNLRGAITKSITKTALRELEIYNVPLELQNQFAEKIKNIEAQKELVKKQAEASENLFQALLQESFSFT